MNYRYDDWYDETEYTKEELSKYLDDYHNNTPEYFDFDNPEWLFEDYVYMFICKFDMTNKTVVLNRSNYTYYIKENETKK